MVATHPFFFGQNSLSMLLMCPPNASQVIQFICLKHQLTPSLSVYGTHCFLPSPVSLLETYG